MNITALLAAVGVFLAMVEANKTTMYADQLTPFPEPETDKGHMITAFKYKPLLNLKNEDKCSSYPAVDKHGVTSKGLPEGDESCAIPARKSQVYSRGRSYNGFWCQMYAWYFPGKQPDLQIWLNIVLFLSSPKETDKHIVRAVAFSLGSSDNDDNNNDDSDTYAALTTPGKDILVNGTTVRVKYASKQLLADKSSGGSFQPLITWDTLTHEARIALDDPLKFNGAEAPFNDVQFETNIKHAFEVTNL